MNKKGITMVSIVIYVVVFFALVAITMGTNMAMNSNSLKDKGTIYVNEAEIKLRNNLTNSVKNSDNVEQIGNKFVFSNEDTYNYDSEKQTLYKNGGILIQNLVNFSFTINRENIGTYKVNFSGKIVKYNQENEFDFNIFKGDI